MPTDDALKNLEAENQRLRSAVRELAVLNEISRVVNSTMPLDQISRVLIKKTVTALSAAEAAVHTFSESEPQAAPKTFVRGKFDSSSLIKARLDINLIGWIMLHKKPLLVNDVAHDERFRKVDLTENPLRSLLAVPLMAKGKLIGALSAFNSQRPAGFSMDDLRLMTIIGAHAAQIIENARFYQEELRLRQLDGEIAAARKIQQGFLPASLPKIAGYDIVGGTQPAREVGGDFFDFIPIGADRLIFTIGDVSGKGVPAALLMATIQGQVRLLTGRDSEASPEKIMNEVNAAVCHLSGSGQFATMIAGRLDGSSHHLHLCNAGHCAPLRLSPDGQVTEISESCLLVGVVNQAEYRCCEMTLAESETLVFLSDGLDEAFNESEDQFGLERVKKLLTQQSGADARDISDALLNEVSSFRGAAPQSDDLTLLVIKRISG